MVSTMPVPQLQVQCQQRFDGIEYCTNKQGIYIRACTAWISASNQPGNYTLAIYRGWRMSREESAKLCTIPCVVECGNLVAHVKSFKLLRDPVFADVIQTKDIVRKCLVLCLYNNGQLVLEITMPLVYSVIKKKRSRDDEDISDELTAEEVDPIYISNHTPNNLGTVSPRRRAAIQAKKRIKMISKEEETQETRVLLLPLPQQELILDYASSRSPSLHGGSTPPVQTFEEDIPTTNQTTTLTTLTALTIPKCNMCNRDSLVISDKCLTCEMMPRILEYQQSRNQYLQQVQEVVDESVPRAREAIISALEQAKKGDAMRAETILINAFAILQEEAIALIRKRVF